MLGVSGEPSFVHMNSATGQPRFRIRPDHQRRGSVVSLSAITP